MIKQILFGLIITFLIHSSCDKLESSIRSNAEILEFNPTECRCCWGWTIRFGSDTIKSANAIVGETVGYEITTPIKVYIKLGAIEDTCSKMSLPNVSRDYYEITEIELIK